MRKKTPLFLEFISFNKLFSPKTGLNNINKKTVFILSTGRTGTKFLAEFFNRAPDVFAVHEPKPSRVLRFWTMAYLQRKVSEPKMREILNKFRAKKIHSTDEEIYIESNNFMAGFTNAITKELEDSTIIHIVRDPRDYVKSAMNKGADSRLKGLANRFLPYAHLPLKRKKHAVLIRTAEYWKLVNEYLEGADSKSSYHLYKFEEIFDPKSKKLENLIGVLGVELVPESSDRNQKVNKAHLKVMKSWESWSNEECRIVDEICGPLMKKYGYGSEPEWKARLKKR